MLESTWTGHVSSQNLRLNKKSKIFWVGDNFFSINQSNDELQLIVISLILWFFVFCQLVGNRLLAKMWFLYSGGHHFTSFLSLWWCTSSLHSVFFFFFWWENYLLKKIIVCATFIFLNSMIVIVGCELSLNMQLWSRSQSCSSLWDLKNYKQMQPMWRKPKISWCNGGGRPSFKALVVKTS